MIKETIDLLDRIGKHSLPLCILYATQTGTAKYYALKLAREVKQRIGSSPVILNVSELNADDLSRLSPKTVVLVIAATYGDGSCPDSARVFTETFLGSQVSLHYRFAALGLGNKSYAHFNALINKYRSHMLSRGAQELLGLVETDVDSCDDEFEVWLDQLWQPLFSALEITAQGPLKIDPEFSVTPIQHDDSVHTFEKSERARKGVLGVHDMQNPYTARITDARFIGGQNTDHETLHVDFDVGESGITWSPGDHVGLWPSNPDSFVQGLLQVLGLSKEKDQALQVIALEPELTPLPCPAKVTYDALFRYHLDISAKVTQSMINAFLPFAVQPTLLMPSHDASSIQIAKYQHLPLHEILASLASAWQIPTHILLSHIKPLQPRFYSISSAQKHTPTLSVTAVVADWTSARGKRYGLTTSYLRSITEKLAGSSADHRETWQVIRPRSISENYYMPIHVRRFAFRLPISAKVPVIMIAAGSGIAPFRSFMQDRVMLAQRTIQKFGVEKLNEWATMWLFFGCRHRQHDYLYENEWSGIQDQLHSKLAIHTAFSRDAESEYKYVQEILRSKKEDLVHAIIHQKAQIYICGRSKMGRDVEIILCELLAEKLGADAASLEIQQLKDRHRFFVDTW